MGVLLSDDVTGDAFIGDESCRVITAGGSTREED